MSTAPIQNIVIVGGGTAGWMTAAAFSHLLGKRYQIRLVESDEIATIGVGEATIPGIKLFNTGLDLNEDEFLRRTQGTFKLGIEFVNWGQLGESYMHGFGKIGHDLGPVSCHHYWLKMRQAGQAPDLSSYSINSVAPKKSKYVRSVPEMTGSPLGDIANAFHFDAGLYAKFLSGYAQDRGVQRTEGKIIQTQLRDSDGYVQAVVLASGERIEGDFFIDCSGIRALLIGQAMGVPYEDWSHWLPCNRAVAVPCASAEHTRHSAHGRLAVAHSLAAPHWQWACVFEPFHERGRGHIDLDGEFRR